MPLPVGAVPPTREDTLLQASDDGLCPFPFEVTISGTGQHHVQQRHGQVTREFFTGSSTVELRNSATGRSVTLPHSGPAFFEDEEGVGIFRGPVVGFYPPGIPLLALRGQTRFGLSDFAMLSDSGVDRVVNPCALLDPAAVSPIPRATPAPWPAPVDVLGGIEVAGLLPVWFAFQRHAHAHLDVFVNGVAVSVPAGIGIAEPIVGADGSVVSALFASAPVHTHTADGIIHVEADRQPLELTLGHFFDVWQVRLTSDCLGAYCADDARTLRVYVNGELQTGDPRSVVLSDFDEIAVVFGPEGVPSVIPDTYDFPPDLGHG
jgi:hypothetical protein